MDYNYRKNVLKHQVKFRRGYRILLTLLILLIITSIAGCIWLWQQLQKPPSLENVSISGQTAKQIARKFIIENDVFFFKSEYYWELSPSDSFIPDKYVYKGMKDKNKNLVEKLLTIHVDSVPKTPATYGVLVEGNNNGQLIVGASTPRCAEFANKNNLNPHEINYKGITFICIPDDLVQTIAVTSQKSGSYNILVTTQSGKQRNVGFVYQDSAVSPRLDVFTDILQTITFK